MLEEYVTGAVLDALESPRVQEAVASGQDTDAPRRAELLEEIRKAQDKRAEARRDWAEDVIDKEDWLESSSAPTTASPAPARSTTGSPGRRPCSVTFPRPTRCATRGRTGTSTGAAPPSRPCSAKSLSAQTPRAQGNPEPCPAHRRTPSADGIRLAALIDLCGHRREHVMPAQDASRRYTARRHQKS